MEKQEVLLLLSYNSWANHKILAAVSRLNPNQFSAPNPCTGYGSIRGVMVHILNAEIIWRSRLQQIIDNKNAYLEPDYFDNLDKLVYRWNEEEALFQVFTESLSDEFLEKMISYTNRRGESFKQSVWTILYHLVNHGTHHRSELSTILTGYGVNPGDLEFIHFLRFFSTENS